MIVQLIPFFLAANMSSEDVSSWSNGPELEFAVYGHIKEHIFNPDMPTISFNSTFNLRCRPKGTDTLSCATTQGKLTIETTNPHKVQTSSHSDVIHMDLKFNEDGAESIMIDEVSFCEKYNMVKRLLGVLNIGANLKEKDRVFETHEDIAMGRCTRSTYEIRTTPQEANEDHPPNLHLIVTPLEMSNEGTTIEISRVRDIDTCNGTTTFFEYIEKSNTTTKVTNAVSKTIITSAGTFKTYNDYRGDVLNEFRNDTIGTIEEFTQLELVSVKEATDDPHVIENPTLHSPMVSSCLLTEED